MVEANPDAAHASPTRRERPWTVMVVVALMIAVMAAQMWADRFALTFSKTSGASYVFSFAMLAIALALLAHGLLRGSRFVWWLALAWQLLDGGYGLLHVLTNGYGWASVAQFTRVGFFEGALPALVAAVNLVLLLVPVTRDWCSARKA